MRLPFLIRLMLAGTLGITLCLSPPAFAQQASDADVTAVRNCVTRQSDQGTGEATLGTCLGDVTESCGGTTTPEISECFMREYRAWDHLLNAWWPALKSSAQTSGTWDGLLAAQRLWIASKDAECERRYNESIGGTIRSIVAAECMRDLTARRAMEIHYMLR